MIEELRALFATEPYEDGGWIRVSEIRWTSPACALTLDGESTVDWHGVRHACGPVAAPYRASPPPQNGKSIPRSLSFSNLLAEN